MKNLYLLFILALLSCKQNPKDPDITVVQPNGDTVTAIQEPAEPGGVIEGQQRTRYEPKTTDTGNDLSAWEWLTDPNFGQRTADFRVPVSASMVRQLTTGINTAPLLFDENLETYWHPGYAVSQPYPAMCVVDFGRPVNITRLRVWDVNGQGRMTVGLSNQDPENGTEVAQFKLDLYKTWHEVPLMQPARYLFISLLENQGDKQIGEIEVYASDNVVIPEDPEDPKPAVCDTAGIVAWYLSTLGGGDPVDTTTSDPGTPSFFDASQSIAVNGFSWAPVSLLTRPGAHFSMIREYGYTFFVLTDKGEYRFDPSFTADINLDARYKALKKAGIKPVPCFNKVPNWIFGSNPEQYDARFHPFGANPTDPKSYKIAAEMGWQIAARYGRKTYPEDMLKVDTQPRWNGDKPNEKLSGLDLLEYIEAMENEAERKWKSPDGRYTPEQLAAHVSAVYDGHEGRLGQGYGIKTADPSMKVVLPGLVSMDATYLNGMLAWFKSNRTDKKFPVDVINFHHYTNEANNKNDTEVNLVLGFGQAPELDNLKQRLKVIVGWCKANVPNAEIWYSEVGWDTEPPPNYPNHNWLSQYPRTYGNYSGRDLQALWLPRAYLIALAAGVDRTFAFNLIDENEAASGGLYLSSGLATGNRPSQGPALEPKPSHGAVMDLIEALKGCKFSKDLSTSQAEIMEFASDAGKKTFYWSPTASGKTVQITVEGQTVTATEKVQWTGPQPIRSRTQAKHIPGKYNPPVFDSPAKHGRNQ
jgi:hypothetical protein